MAHHHHRRIHRGHSGGLLGSLCTLLVLALLFPGLTVAIAVIVLLGALTFACTPFAYLGKSD